MPFTVGDFVVGFGVATGTGGPLGASAVGVGAAEGFLVDMVGVLVGADVIGLFVGREVVGLPLGRLVGLRVGLEEVGALEGRCEVGAGVGRAAS